nr:transposase (putative), gypsy type [Tanacetum cinerariifolium]
LYTRFFDFANFKLSLSTFLVNILRLFRCFYANSKKNGWMSFVKRGDKSLVCYTKPLDSLKIWNDHFFWVDDFACPTSFPCRYAKNVTRDPALKATDFNAQDYATLVAHPSLFRKFPEEFLCLVGLSRHYTLDEDTYPSFVDRDGEDMDIFAFIHTADPTKVKVFKREQQEDEPWLLETTVDRTVPLLPVAPDRGESELEASVDKLFDEGGSGTQVEQGDSAGIGGGQGINIQPAVETIDIVAEDEVSLQPRCQKKRKIVVAGAAVHNAEVWGDPIHTLPFVTSSISATSEREGEDSSHHSGANIAEAEVDSFDRPSAPIITSATTVTSTADPTVVVKEKVLEPSLFAVESTYAGGTDPAMAGLKDLTGIDFLTGGIRTLFTEFNVGAARQMSLSAEVRMRAEYNIREKLRLKFVVEEKNQVLKARDEKIKNLKARLQLKEAEAAKAIRFCAKTSKLETTEKSLRDEVTALNERNIILEKERNALDVKETDLEPVVVSKERELTNSASQLTYIKSQNDNLADQVHELQVSSSELKEKLSDYENLTERLKEFQDAQLKVVNDKFDKLYTDFVEVTLHLEERFYPHLLTTIVGRKWILTHGMELAIAKCLNSPEYLSAFGTAVSKAIKKELKENKDASIEAMMNILCLQEHLAERLGLNESQPHADQLMVPIHHSLDKIVIGASALSLALDVSDARVQRIRENIMSHRSLFQDVFIPLAKPLSAAALTGMEGTFDVVPTTAYLTIALSVTLASTDAVTPIFVDDYGDVGTDDQSVVNEKVADIPSLRKLLSITVSLLIFSLFQVLSLPRTVLPIYGIASLCPSLGLHHCYDSRIVASSLLSFKRSKLISRASLFPTRSTSAVLTVGMPISARMTASVSYANENGVSPLLDFIIMRAFWKRSSYVDSLLVKWQRRCDWGQ